MQQNPNWLQIKVEYINDPIDCLYNELDLSDNIEDMIECT